MPKLSNSELRVVAFAERGMWVPRARLVGLAALIVAALAMIGVLALALYGAQHVLQTIVVA
jgi:hypothetical protein